MHRGGMERETKASGSGPVRIGSILLGVAFFFASITIVPLAWMLVVPLSVAGWALWMFAAGAAALACLVGTVRQPQGVRRRAAATVGLVLTLIALPVLGGCAALNALISGFNQTTVEARVTSPNGRLTATQEYVDQGALGGDTVIRVTARCVPGLMSWSYDVPIPYDSSPESLMWRDEQTLIVDGRAYRIPGVIVLLGW